MIEAHGVSVRYGTSTILHNLSVHIECGALTAIVGPNGAGKSTLLGCLTGSCIPDSGTVTLDGQALADYSLKQLACLRSVLLQSSTVNFPFTTSEIVMMGRHLYTQADSDENNHIVSQALGCVDALHLQQRFVSTLSGGEQQRVHIARILAQVWGNNSAYLLLDEPTSALDLKHQHQILHLLRDLTKNKNYAVCTIIHDLNLAMRYADHTILLKDGQLYAAGDTKTTLTAEAIQTVFEVSQEVMEPIIYA